MGLAIRPNSKPQEQFLASNVQELFYGGSAGSGKSMMLVIDPLRYIQIPEFQGILFRNSFGELDRYIIPLMKEYYPLYGAEWSVSKSMWTFPSGAKMYAGFLEGEEDWKKYQGAPWDWQGYDEAPNIRKTNIEMMAAWSRSKSGKVKAVRRFTGNPGGISHSYFRQMFVDPMPAVPDGPPVWSELGQMMWQPMKSGGPFKYYVDREANRAITRQFIPARIFDNADLLKNNPNYLNVLLNMPAHLRQAMLEGRWDVFEGQYFPWNRTYHIIGGFGTTPPPAHWNKVGGLDYGSTTTLEIQASTPEGIVINFAESQTVGLPPTEKAIVIADFLKEHKLHRLRIRYDTDMKNTWTGYAGSTKSPLNTFKEVFAQKMKGNAPIMVPVIKKGHDNVRFRVVCNEVFLDHMSWAIDKAGVLTKKPRFVITEDCPKLIACIPEIVQDPDSYKGMDFKDPHSAHTFDSAKYALLDIGKSYESIVHEKKDTPEYYKLITSRRTVNTWRDPFRV